MPMRALILQRHSLKSTFESPYVRNKPSFMNELEEAFLSFKVNKKSSHYDVSSVFSKLLHVCVPFKFIFGLFT